MNGKDDRISCAVARDLMPLYIEELTSGETAEAVGTHIAGCPGCRAAYEAMRGADAVPAVPAPLPEGGVDFMRKTNRSLLIAVVAVVVCLFLLLGLVFGLGRVQPIMAEEVAVVDMVRLSDGSIAFQTLLAARYHKLDAISYTNAAGNGEEGVVVYQMGYTPLRLFFGNGRLPDVTVHRIDPDTTDVACYGGWGTEEREIIWQAGDEVPDATPEQEAWYLERGYI